MTPLTPEQVKELFPAVIFTETEGSPTMTAHTPSGLTITSTPTSLAETLISHMSADHGAKGYVIQDYNSRAYYTTIRQPDGTLFSRDLAIARIYKYKDGATAETQRNGLKSDTRKLTVVKVKIMETD